MDVKVRTVLGWAFLFALVLMADAIVSAMFFNNELARAIFAVGILVAVAAIYRILTATSTAATPAEGKKSWWQVLGRIAAIIVAPVAAAEIARAFSATEETVALTGDIALLVAFVFVLLTRWSSIGEFLKSVDLLAILLPPTVIAGLVYLGITNAWALIPLTGGVLTIGVLLARAIEKDLVKWEEVTTGWIFGVLVIATILVGCFVFSLAKNGAMIGWIGMVSLTALTGLAALAKRKNASTVFGYGATILVPELLFLSWTYLLPTSTRDFVLAALVGLVPGTLVVLLIHFWNKVRAATSWITRLVFGVLLVVLFASAAMSIFDIAFQTSDGRIISPLTPETMVAVLGLTACWSLLSATIGKKKTPEGAVVRSWWYGSLKFATFWLFIAAGVWFRWGDILAILNHNGYAHLAYANYKLGEAVREDLARKNDALAREILFGPVGVAVPGAALYDDEANPVATLPIGGPHLDEHFNRASSASLDKESTKGCIRYDLKPPDKVAEFFENKTVGRFTLKDGNGVCTKASIHGWIWGRQVSKIEHEPVFGLTLPAELAQSKPTLPPSPPPTPVVQAAAPRSPIALCPGTHRGEHEVELQHGERVCAAYQEYYVGDGRPLFYIHGPSGGKWPVPPPRGVDFTKMVPGHHCFEGGMLGNRLCLWPMNG